MRTQTAAILVPADRAENHIAEPVLMHLHRLIGL